VAVAALECMEDGGELFRESEKAAVRGRLLIAQSLNKATGCEARAGDAGGEPGLIYLGKKPGDLIPAGSFAGLAGVAHEYDVEIETVASGIDHAVGPGPGEIAKDSEQLEEQGGRVGLGVGSDGANGAPGEAVKSGLIEGGVRSRRQAGCSGCFGSRQRGYFRERGEIQVRFTELKFGQEAEEFSVKSVGESRQMRPGGAGSGCF